MPPYKTGKKSTLSDEITPQTVVADATGGATVDAEARTAINAINARLKNLGLIASS